MTNATPWGTELRLDSDSGPTFDSTISGLATGKLVSTFTLLPFRSDTVKLHGQMIDANGYHHGTEFPIDAQATGDQIESASVALSNGGFAFAWDDRSATTPNALAQVFDAEGHALGSSFALGTTGDWRMLPQFAARPDGGFVATWGAYTPSTSDFDIDVRVFDADGSTQRTFVAKSPDGIDPDVAVLADGRIVAAWDSFGKIEARIFNIDGTTSVREFTITGTNGDSPHHVQLAALRDGGFAAVWDALENGEDTDIHAQLYDANGNKSAGDILVNTTTNLSQYDAHITQLSDGRLAVAWEDSQQAHSSDIRLQLINLDGTKSGDELLVNHGTPGAGERPDITVLADGRFAVSWHENWLGDPHEAAQIFDARTGPVHLTGTAFNDDYYGTAFDDSMKGLAGDDRFDSGAGSDTVEYAGDRSQYQIIDKGDHVEVQGPEGTDTLYNVEYLKFGALIVPIGSAPPPPDPVPPAPPAEPPAPPPGPDDVITGLFDTGYYLTHYGDVSAANVSGFDHFNNHGWHEGRDPNAWFDTSAYLAVNRDVAASGVNPMIEYHQSGWREERDPGPNFDARLYLVHNPDVAAANVDPLEHYLQHGMSEGRAIYAAVGHAVNGFDAEWYLFHNPDVAAAGVDPLQHYQQNGWHEGRNPNPWFDTAGYLAHYQDVAATGIDPLLHYEQNGWKEGRDPSAGFDTLGYLAANPDVAAAGINPLDHFINSGIYEGRVAVNDGVWH